MTARKCRGAPKYDRDVAAMIASALRRPLGPNDPLPPGFNEVPIDHVIGWLEHFVEHGTFDHAASQHLWKRKERAVMIPGRYRWLRSQGETYESAVAALAVEFGCSESTVRALVPSVKKRPPLLK